MAKNEQSPDEHRKALAGSGYRLPAEIYVQPPGVGLQSAEAKSGDGGATIGDAQAQAGYQGALKTPEEVALDAAKLRTVDPETGLTIPGEPEVQAEIARTGTVEAMKAHEEEEYGTSAAAPQVAATLEQQAAAEGGQKNASGPTQNKAATAAKAKK